MLQTSKLPTQRPEPCLHFELRPSTLPVDTRIAPPNYSDGIGSMVSGPSPRYVSNRIFNDVGQNIFSENRVSQWGWLWAQFLDHTFGLRDETPAERTPIPFERSDPLERFKDDAGAKTWFVKK